MPGADGWRALTIDSGRLGASWRFRGDDAAGIKKVALPGFEWVGGSLYVHPVKALGASFAVLRPFG